MVPSELTTLSTGMPSRPARQRGTTRYQSIDHSGRYALRADPQDLSIALTNRSEGARPELDPPCL